VDLSGPPALRFHTEQYGHGVWQQGFYGHGELVSLSVEAPVGRICKAAVVSPGRNIRFEVPDVFARLPVTEGIPVVDRGLFDAIDEPLEIPVVEEERHLRLWTDGHTVIVEFDDATVPDRCLRAEGLDFFVSGDLLCGLGYRDLDLTRFRDFMAEVAASVFLHPEGPA
jgi:hypothetical protein